MKIADIKIGERHRKDMGDVATLAESIKTKGLLQPVGVTEDNELVFGYRRLLACRDILGWHAIDHRVVNVTSIVDGEYTENEVRKDFTVSERVAILMTMKRRKHGGDRKSQHREQDEDLHLAPSTEELVKKVGFGNTTTAREATAIVDKGITELVAAVDRGDIAIEPGFAIALQPEEQQAAIVKLPKAERHAAVRQLARPSKPTGAKPQKFGHLRTPRKKHPDRFKRVDPPYLKLEVATDEETGRPDANVLSPEFDRWRKKHGKVPLYSTKGRDLLTCADATGQFVQQLVAIASGNQLDPENFFKHIDQMLAHVPQRGKTNGEEIDFAKDARASLGLIERDLDTAIKRLTGFRTMLAQRASGKMPEVEADRSVVVQ